MRLTPDQFWTYFEWLFEQYGLLQGFLLVLVLAILGFLIGFIVAMLKYGPTEGFLQVSKVIRELFVVDLPKTSIRRVTAIARLAIKEAIRKKVLVVVGVFVVAIMFAGWYLDPKADYPARLYISFVLSATNYMVLLLGLFLSCFSLPADIKSRTIYTIVTKPVRPTEIFLGRVFGFIAVGTLILVLLAGMSYLFVVRGLDHQHEAKEISGEGTTGITTTQHFHSHTFTLDESGEGSTNESKGHRHLVRKEGDKIVVGPPVDDLTARVPLYGTMRFTGRDGEDNTGYNVGYMSEYQKYIEGDTLSSAIWTFKGVRPSQFSTELNYDMTISAFRTYKGDIVTPVGGVVIFRSIDGKVESERFPFKVKEFQIDQRSVSTKMKGFRDGEPADLDFFKDIAPDGKFEIVIRCQDRGQYLGMAAGDVYLRAQTLPFWWNFVKGYISIWLQMVIVICFGVMFSTFLSGPVAIIATVSFIVLGFFGGFVDAIVAGKIEGGGPVEALIRIPMQSGSGTQLDLGNPVLENTIRVIDKGLLIGVQTLKSAIPNFIQLGTADFVAYGVNLFGGLLSRHLTICAGYFLLTSIVSYFFLKTREMAA
jgi:ABC-type transport system involved in multi-copper enzyme maturation permease subunit